MKKIAIVGGGFLGMVLAKELAKNNSVVIFEKNKHLGGLASTTVMGEMRLEKYYHHFFAGDKFIQELIQELDLSDKLQWLESKVGFYVNGKIHNFSTAIDLLKFSELSIFDRIRAGFMSFYLQRRNNINEFEKITAYKWGNKYYGSKVFSKIWEPLLIGKFGLENYKKVLMSWLWARIHDRSSSRKGLFAKEFLGYPEGSFQIVIDALEKKIVENNVIIKKEYSIKNYSAKAGKHYIDQIEFDKVVVTTDPEFLITMFKPDRDYIQKLSKIQFLGANCLILKIKHSFSGYYWINVAAKNFPFLAVVEHTNLIKYNDENAYIYIGNYLSRNSEEYSLNAEQLIDQYIPYLQKINPDFQRDWIEEYQFFKAPFAQHIVDKNYQVLPFSTGIDNLYYANFAQIYPHDRGTNYAVEQAYQLYKLLDENQ